MQTGRAKAESIQYNVGQVASPVFIWGSGGMISKEKQRPSSNREFLVTEIRSMNNRFHSEAKLPWSYPLANHIATNKSSANREMPLFSGLYPHFGYLRKVFPPRV